MCPFFVTFLNLGLKALYDVMEIWEVIFSFLLDFCIRSVVVFKACLGDFSSTDWPAFMKAQTSSCSPLVSLPSLSPSWLRALAVLTSAHHRQVPFCFFTRKASGYLSCLLTHSPSALRSHRPDQADGRAEVSSLEASSTRKDLIISWIVSSQNSYVAGLNPRTSECDLVGKQGHSICN